MKQSLIVAFLLLTLPIAGAHGFSAKAIKIDHPWAKPNTSAEAPGLVYFTLENTGAEDDRLLRVTIDRELAEASQLRSIDRTGGKVTVTYLAQGLALPAGTSAPEGYYVMLTGLSETLIEGRRFPVTLVFEHAGAITVDVGVEAAPKPDKHPVIVAERHEGYGS